MVRTPGTLDSVPDQPKNKHRMVRFSDEDWADLGEMAGSLESDRSAILRQLAHWWMRRPGAKLPARPEPHLGSSGK
jgi:hypothetical protein